MTTSSFSTCCTKINTAQISFLHNIHYQSFQGRTATVLHEVGWYTKHSEFLVICHITHYLCLVWYLKWNEIKFGLDWEKGQQKVPFPWAHRGAEMLQTPGCCHRFPGSLSAPYSKCLSKQLSPNQRLEIRCLCCWFIGDLGILRMFWTEARLMFFQMTLTITLNWVRESPPGNHTSTSDIKVALPACLSLPVWK